MDMSTPKGAPKSPPRKMTKGDDGRTEGDQPARPGGQAPAAPARPHGQIAREVEDDIVPRLVLAHRSHGIGGHRARAASRAVTEEDLSRFTDIVIRESAPAALDWVGTMRARGVALEAVYLDLLAPVARRLGELWSADLCDFTAVTLGLWRLQQVARELSPAFRRDAEPRLIERRALLATVPGEQHTFGLTIVADFFRRAGWNVATEISASPEALVARVQRESFAIVGLSLSCGARLEGLASFIHALRRASRNRALGVMVGGPMLAEHPELAALVGADATAADGHSACLQAESLVAVLSGRRDAAALGSHFNRGRNSLS